MPPACVALVLQIVRGASRRHYATMNEINHIEQHLRHYLRPERVRGTRLFTLCFCGKLQRKRYDDLRGAQGTRADDRGLWIGIDVGACGVVSID